MALQQQDAATRMIIGGNGLTGGGEGMKKVMEEVTKASMKTIVVAFL